MDPASARALVCTAKRPIGRVADVVLQTYIHDHRSPSLLDTTPELPGSRCIMKSGRGRCRKQVSGVALTQYCWKHQARRGICDPGDATLCHWNFNKLFQKVQCDTCNPLYGAGVCHPWRHS